MIVHENHAFTGTFIFPELRRRVNNGEIRWKDYSVLEKKKMSKNNQNVIPSENNENLPKTDWRTFRNYFHLLITITEFTINGFFKPYSHPKKIQNINNVQKVVCFCDVMEISTDEFLENWIFPRDNESMSE